MEILKKIILAIGVTVSIYSSAQDSRNSQLAFSKSCGFESKYQYDEAIKAIKEVYNEKSYPMNTRLGWLCYLNKNYTSSIAYYQKASSLMPAAAEPLWAMVSPLLAAEKWGELEKNYLSIVKIEPKSAIAHYKLGLIYYYRKNYSAAKKFFDISLNLYPMDYDSLLMSAWTNYFLGNKDAAKILFNKVLLLYISDSSALEGLSLIK